MTSMMTSSMNERDTSSPSMTTVAAHVIIDADHHHHQNVSHSTNNVIERRAVPTTAMLTAKTTVSSGFASSSSSTTVGSTNATKDKSAISELDEHSSIGPLRSSPSKDLKPASSSLLPLSLPLCFTWTRKKIHPIKARTTTHRGSKRCHLLLLFVSTVIIVIVTITTMKFTILLGDDSLTVANDNLLLSINPQPIQTHRPLMTTTTTSSQQPQDLHQVSTNNTATAAATTTTASSMTKNTTSFIPFSTIRSPNDDTIGKIKYYVLTLPQTTDDLISSSSSSAVSSTISRGKNIHNEHDQQQHQQQNNINNNKMDNGRSSESTLYYEQALNEESAEMWLHRAFTSDPQLVRYRTMNPTEADVFVITGCLHLYKHYAKITRTNHDKQDKQQPQAQQRSTVDHSFVSRYNSLIVEPTKPHLLLVPSWNPKVSREIGIQTLVKQLNETLVPRPQQQRYLQQQHQGPENQQQIQQQQIHQRRNQNPSKTSSSHLPSLLWSVGFERNPMWQGRIAPSNIVPVPYVVRMRLQSMQYSTSTHSSSNDNHINNTNSSRSSSTGRAINGGIRIDDYHQQYETHQKRQRIPNFVFYAGARRKNAENWAGCYRSQLLEPFQQLSSVTLSVAEQQQQQNIPKKAFPIDIRLVDKNQRMNQTTYNERMATSDYCLVVCGDTPSSRSLTTAMVLGCIPIRVGSRLRGLCESPCKVGFGWTVTGIEYPHLPYTETIPWSDFPEVNEQELMMSSTSSPSISTMDQTKQFNGTGAPVGSYEVLKRAVFDALDDKKKDHLRDVMDTMHDAFIYGYGNPVTSIEFGGASLQIWKSFVAAAIASGSIPASRSRI